MKILIEDAETLEFLTSDGHWTKVVAEGKLFAGTRLAFEAAKKELIRKFNIVCYIKETNQFINLDHGRGKGGEASAA